MFENHLSEAMFATCHKTKRRSNRVSARSITAEELEGKRGGGVWYQEMYLSNSLKSNKSSKLDIVMAANELLVMSLLISLKVSCMEIIKVF